MVLVGVKVVEEDDKNNNDENEECGTKKPPSPPKWFPALEEPDWIPVEGGKCHARNGTATDAGIRGTPEMIFADPSPEEVRRVENTDA